MEEQIDISQYPTFSKFVNADKNLKRNGFEQVQFFDKEGCPFYPGPERASVYTNQVYVAYVKLMAPRRFEVFTYKIHKQ